MFDVAVTYILDHRDRVVLGEKLTGLGRGNIVAPGGKAWPGERPAETAAREVAEEVGLEIDPADLVHQATISYPFVERPELSQRSFVFIARRFRGRLRSSDELSARWWPIHEIPFERMWADARLWLPGALAGRYLEATIEIARDDAVARHDLKWHERRLG